MSNNDTALAEVTLARSKLMTRLSPLPRMVTSLSLLYDILKSLSSLETWPLELLSLVMLRSLPLFTLVLLFLFQLMVCQFNRSLNMPECKYGYWLVVVVVQVHYITH